MYFFKIILVSLVILPSLLGAETLSVQVKQTVLRSKPSFLGKLVAKLKYADRVQSQKSKNGWNYVKTLDGAKAGWVSSSALIDKKIVLSSSKKLSNSSASQSEVLMAGKGFSKEVESEYKKTNKELNFAQVDRIEKIKPISRTKLINFAKNGKLNI